MLFVLYFVALSGIRTRCPIMINRVILRESLKSVPISNIIMTSHADYKSAAFRHYHSVMLMMTAYQGSCRL